MIVLTDRARTMADVTSHAWRYVVTADNGDRACSSRGIYICQESDMDVVWEALHRRYGDRLMAVEHTSEEKK